MKMRSFITILYGKQLKFSNKYLKKNILSSRISLFFTAYKREFNIFSFVCIIQT